MSTLMAQLESSLALAAVEADRMAAAARARSERAACSLFAHATGVDPIDPVRLWRDPATGNLYRFELRVRIRLIERGSERLRR